MADRLVLVGMMGSGKTTVGRELAGRLGWAFLDSDAMVEASTGSTVAELFAERGEDGVPGRGGPGAGRGAGRHRRRRWCRPPAARCWPPDNRALLATEAIVVWLRADPATLAGRVGTGAGRPLLGDDPAARLVELDAVRRPLYEEVADVVVDVDDLDPSRVADRILAAHRLRAEPTVTRVVPVDLAERSYEVVVGDGARHELARVVAETVPSARRAVVVTQEGIGVEVDPGLPFEVVHRARRRVGQVARPGRGAVPPLRPVGAEPGRRGGGRRRAAWSPTWPASPPRRSTGAPPTSTWPRRCWPRWTRPSAARPGSTSPRGRTWSVPSGSPRAVLCDTATLATLPPREWASGRGEMAKYALLGIETPFGGAPTADLPARRAGGPVRGHQGRGGGRRRARGGPADAPQLRPHPGPRPRGVGLRRRRRGPPPRRGGGRRPGLRRPAGPAPRPHRRRPGRAPPAGGRRLRPGRRPAGRHRPRAAARRSWAGTRRPRAT